MIPSEYGQTGPVARFFREFVSVSVCKDNFLLRHDRMPGFQK